ncbi:MAG: 50S ribosomal protein L10 [candidate division KSB1 bacterium]|nr:50S ribosomal protein L10 [candidate division KSB1 bacterium]
MPTPKKVEEVEFLTENIRQAKGIYLTDFTGMTVEEMNELRARLRQEKILYRVVKNTLTRIALERAGFPGQLDSYLEGPTALAFGFDDPVTPARVLRDFARQRPKLRFKASLVDGRVFGAEETEKLADLPPRNELLARLLGQLNAPITGLVWTLHGSLAKLVYVLQAIKEKKEQTQAS